MRNKQKKPAPKLPPHPAYEVLIRQRGAKSAWEHACCYSNLEDAIEDWNYSAPYAIVIRSLANGSVKYANKAARAAGIGGRA